MKLSSFKQYVYNKALYVYFRYNKKQTVMYVINTSDKAKDIDFKKYAERTNGFLTSSNILLGAMVGKERSTTVDGKNIGF